MTKKKATKSRRITYRPHPDPAKAKSGEKVKSMSLDFKIIKEDWNTYELEDGTRARVRIHATAFERPLDPKTDGFIYDREGKPHTGMELGVETFFEYPEELLKP